MGELLIDDSVSIFYHTVVNVNVVVYASKRVFVKDQVNRLFGGSNVGRFA